MPDKNKVEILIRAEYVVYSGGLSHAKYLP